MYLALDQPDELVAATQAAPLESDEYWLILVADCHQPQLEDMIQALNTAQIRFFGGIFPGLLLQNKALHKGAILKKLRCIAPPVRIQLPATTEETEALLPPSDQIPDVGATCITLLDCLSVGIDDLLTTLYNRYGTHCSYFGAGTGNQQLSPGQTVFGPWGCDQNCGLVALVNQTSNCIAQHGWQPCSEPMIASRTESTLLKELDWTDAEEAYRQALPESLRDVSDKDFFKKVTTHYPLALEYPGNETIIRDPIALCGNGDVLFISSIPQGAVMYLVKNDNQNIIDAARIAVNEATRDQKPESILVCDCLSRTFALGDEFSNELDVVHQTIQSKYGHVELEGVLAIGEIASNGHRPVRFNNKTFGICSFNDH